jgi:Arc/MetJ family transcription regulator
MPRIMEDVDGALLAEAQRLLDTSSAPDTINHALADLIRERRRRQAVESQLRRFEAGQFAVLPRTGGAR